MRWGNDNGQIFGGNIILRGRKLTREMTESIMIIKIKLKINNYEKS